MTKIVCIGAGSFSFGLSTLITLLRSKSLDGSEIALVDINPEALDLMSRLAEWLNSEWDCNKRLSSHSSHKNALNEANFVINSIEVQPRETYWHQDWALTMPYGLRQPYGENGGPGGFGHTARNVNTILEIARDIEAACPQALLINFSNPMHRLCYLLNEYTNVKTVGLCHQLSMGYAMAAKSLAGYLGTDPGDDFVSCHADPVNYAGSSRMAKIGREHFSIIAAGLNHFSWILDITDRKTGKSLMNEFKKGWETLDPSFEPLTREIYSAFGLFPVPGDEHLVEYLPWMSNPQTKPWERYDLSLYDWELMAAIRDFQWDHVNNLVGTRSSTEMFEDPASEGALEIIEGLFSEAPITWEAANIRNEGFIEGLPDNAVVEVPADISKTGIQGHPIGAFPKGITGLLQREVHTSQLCVDAIVHGDRQLALQSLLLDPVINDIEIAKSVLDDILSSNKQFLPQFWN